MTIKRYQRWTKDGLSWSKWFPWVGSMEEKFQIKNKLSNEYKEVTEDEWFQIEKEQDEKK